jgi:hypothetical protein
MTWLWERDSRLCLLHRADLRWYSLLTYPSDRRQSGAQGGHKARRGMRRSALGFGAQAFGFGLAQEILGVQLYEIQHIIR